MGVGIAVAIGIAILVQVNRLQNSIIIHSATNPPPFPFSPVFHIGSYFPAGSKQPETVSCCRSAWLKINSPVARSCYSNWAKLDTRKKNKNRLAFKIAEAKCLWPPLFQTNWLEFDLNSLRSWAHKKVWLTFLICGSMRSLSCPCLKLAWHK